MTSYTVCMCLGTCSGTDYTLLRADRGKNAPLVELRDSVTGRNHHYHYSQSCGVNSFENLGFQVNSIPAFSQSSKELYHS